MSRPLPRSDPDHDVMADIRAAVASAWAEGISLQPPAWPEQEWCDGGLTCQHPACIEEAEYENRMASDDPYDD